MYNSRNYLYWRIHQAKVRKLKDQRKKKEKEKEKATIQKLIVAFWNKK